MSYPVSTTPRVFVDHGALEEMLRRVSQPNCRAVLVGFGEYAKHLVNLCGENILAIHDPSEWKHGIQFRGVPVVGLKKVDDATVIVACEYKYSYEYIAKIVGLYGRVPYFIPSRISDKTTDQIDVFAQEEFYQRLFSERSEAPISMMQEEKLKFLIEMLRLGLTFEGDVVEMGSWQAGSTWYMAKSLTLLKEKRRLFAMDLFETHSMDPTATMCTDEIRRSLTRAYPDCEVIVGLIDQDENLERIPGKLCFAHIDLGPIPKAMQFVWDRLSIGAPILLDNYGHIGAPTWEFDKFFEALGTRVTRLPWSEQGLVFKR